MLLWLYGMASIIVWMWKCICTGKQWRETHVLAQAGLSRPGKNCRTGQIHTRALAQAKSSRLSETSRSGKRDSPKRDRVRTLVVAAVFSPGERLCF